MRINAAAGAALLLAVVAVAGCQQGQYEAAQGATLETDAQKANYGFGLQVGTSLKGLDSHLEMAAFLRGIQDAMEERDPAVTQDDIQNAMMQLQTTINEEQQAEMAVKGEENKQAGEAFLAENAAKAGVMTTESGLQYEVLREGDGPKPGPDDEVTINYRGTLPDGTQFDSSYDRGQPSTFQVGGVIQGFAEALQMMPVGSQYRFVIPADLAYGEAGSGPLIGPNQTLIFEVEMISISE